MNKWIKLALLLTIPISTTGCWDRVEIEQRGFVVGAGIELAKESDHKEDKEAEGKPKGKQRYKLTYQFVVPSSMGEKGGGSSKKAYFNLSSTGDSMFEITREMATRVGRSPYLEQLKVLLVSDELARNPGHFANAVDFFLRYNQTRRGTKVFIVKGSPAEAFEFNPESEKLTVDYIQSVAKNHLRTGRILEPFLMGRLEEKLLLETSYAIPRLVVLEKEVKIAGAAVFHGQGNRFVGWLGEEETEGLSFLRDEMKTGVVAGKVEDNLIDFETKGSKRKIKLDDSDLDHMKFTFDMDVEGIIVESLETLDYMTYPATLEAQRSIEKEIKRLCEDTIHKLKDDFKVDAIGLGTYIKRYHPKTWDKVRTNWDTGKHYFSKSSIDINVNVIIRNPGIVTESESHY